MGTDIHAWVEVKINHNYKAKTKWIAIHEIKDKGLMDFRDYLWFDIIAGVRPGNIEPISRLELRGEPDDMSDTFRYWMEEEGYHSVNWATIEELKNILDENRSILNHNEDDRFYEYLIPGFSDYEDEEYRVVFGFDS